MSIGENIRRIREDKDITQVAVAEYVGVTQSMIAQIEKNIKIPSLPVAKRIAEVLKVDINEFFGA